MADLMVNLITISNFAAFILNLQGCGSCLRLNEDSDIKKKRKDECNCFVPDAVVLGRAHQVDQILELCCFSVAMLVFLSNTHLGSSQC